LNSNTQFESPLLLSSGLLVLDPTCHHEKNSTTRVILTFLNNISEIFSFYDLGHTSICMLHTDRKCSNREQSKSMICVTHAHVDKNVRE